MSFLLAVFLFAYFAPYKWKLWVYRKIVWLIEIAYLFFVDFVIFLKPLKKHREKVGFYLWLILVFIATRYLIIKKPGTPDINSAYLFFVGYVYTLSAMYLIKIIIEFVGKTKKDLNE